MLCLSDDDSQARLFEKQKVVVVSSFLESKVVLT